MRTGGVSLLELAVVAVIIALVGCIVFPALRDAHEHARRLQCANNLRQIGIAFHNYYDSFEVYPPGYVARDVSATDPMEAETGPGYAWGAMLLPFLEQSALYGAIDFSVTPQIPAGTMVMVYQCPSDPDQPPMSYVGSFGYGSLSKSPGAPVEPGMLYRNSGVRDFDIADGGSNTILIGERAATHDFVAGQSPVDATAAWLAAPQLARPAGATAAGDAREGPASWVLGNVGQSEPFPVPSGPCRTNHVASFSSRHPETCGFLCVDGSVHHVSTEIEADAFRKLGQRDDLRRRIRR